MTLPEELIKYDQRLLRDLLQLGPAHPRTRDHEDAEEVWYYLMTYSFVELKPYVERMAIPQRQNPAHNANIARHQSHSISTTGRALLKHLNEQLAS